MDLYCSWFQSGIEIKTLPYRNCTPQTPFRYTCFFLFCFFLSFLFLSSFVRPFWFFGWGWGWGKVSLLTPKIRTRTLHTELVVNIYEEPLRFLAIWSGDLQSLCFSLYHFWQVWRSKWPFFRDFEKVVSCFLHLHIWIIGNGNCPCIEGTNIDHLIYKT